jgi:hypothetical protein
MGASLTPLEIFAGLPLVRVNAGAPAKPPDGAKKEPPESGSKVYQGGVHQSGQEPLNRER